MVSRSEQSAVASRITECSSLLQEMGRSSAEALTADAMSHASNILKGLTQDVLPSSTHHDVQQLAGLVLSRVVMPFE